MTEHDETDDQVDMARDSIALTREENSRIRAMDHDAHVAWDRFSYVDESDWRTHGIA